MNAIAHSVEALYAEDANPIVSLMACEGSEKRLAKALPAIVEKAGMIAMRAGKALYLATGLAASRLRCGHQAWAFITSSCHTLGGAFDLSHAETHTIVLPHAVAYNSRATQPAMARIAKALEAGEAAMGLYDLSGRIGAKRALRDIGMPESGIGAPPKMASLTPIESAAAGFGGDQRD